MANRAGLHTTSTFGEKAAGVVSRTLGSWRFVLTQTAIIILWMATGGFGRDPMPFLLMNVCLSLQAAYAAPILQLSSNRQESINQRRDDLEAEEVERDLAMTQEMHAMQKELLALQRTQMQILDLLKERR